jgi:UDP:flavonoid glycosyltransferase YjiC (YdhE family)
MANSVPLEVKLFRKSASAQAKIGSKSAQRKGGKPVVLLCPDWKYRVIGRKAAIIAARNVNPTALVEIVNPSCLFLINGLGMGNSTRCHAVIENLAAAGVTVHVLTSGNGLAYFDQKKEVASVTPMESFFYSGRQGGISGWATLMTLPTLLKRAKKKREQLTALLSRLEPDVAVIDSEYSIAPLHRKKVPIVGLNTSEFVVTEYLKHRKVARGVRSHFWFVEFSDYLFHKRNCDLILSPFPVRTPTRSPKFKRIGLIVRRAVLERVQIEAKKTSHLKKTPRVVFMLSGSVHASNIPFEKFSLPFQVDVVGRNGESSPLVTYHGRKMDNTQLLADADVLVINGGYSAVSEAFVLNKPVFVVPVPGHAEQFVNAHLVQDLGLGRVATESDVLDQLLEHFRVNPQGVAGKKPVKYEINGAREASDLILQTAHANAGIPCAESVAAVSGRI